MKETKNDATDLIVRGEACVNHSLEFSCEYTEILCVISMIPDFNQSFDYTE